ncbi:MAG: GspH/FimT family pseudopilin [Proteobacteria bacterium]|uniref:GspH/FimT family pseudopilin n=1 Tax=Rudaea sp. TaxID=2136325 RepID=UPI001E0A9BB3|nr:GspH/FimT family pseudopilin [Pseudomonadota bacterium]MBS0568672.1 GspH/FimT family pseudopilin [Pseudomonadota bacterium]
MRNSPAANQLGITLIELIFTLAIVAVLASLSAPALGNLIQRSHARNAHDMLVGSLSLARTSSVSTHREVIVCPSNDHATCSDGIWWQHGWIVFEDANQNNHRDEDEPLLEVVDSQPGIAIATSSGRKFVRYRPDGSASGTDLTYTICDRRGAGEAAAVIVSNPGRVREARPDPARATVACAGLGR